MMVLIELDNDECYEIEKLLDYHVGALCDRAMKLEGMLAINEDKKKEVFMRGILDKYAKSIHTFSKMQKIFEGVRKNG